MRGFSTGLKITTISLGVAFLLTSPVFGETASTRGKAAIEEGNARVEAELLVEVPSVVAGANVRVGVLLRMDPGWHVYWKNSGDSGFPTEIVWSSPDATFGPLRFPAPKVFLESGGLATTYGYSDEVLLFSDATVGEEATGTIRIHAEVRFLVCKILCIPGEIRLDTVLPVGLVADRNASSTRALFDRFASQLPVLAEELGIVVQADFSVEVVLAGEAFELGIAVTPCESSLARCPKTVAFAASPGEFAVDVSDALTLDRIGILDPPDGGEGALLVMRGRVLKGQSVPDVIEGVLALSVDGRPRAVAISLALPREGDGSVVRSIPGVGTATGNRSSGLEGPSLWVALSFGLLGGLILNLMPCVLPVLAIKAFRIVEAGASGQRELRRQGSAFTLGVLLSMLVLAAVVLGLRSAGEAVGWGFHFQQPMFLVFMAALLTVFALNLFGIFEITVTPVGVDSLGNPSGATLQSFLDGGLAVLLATPCSAPFLGTAVGFAFAGSWVVVIAVFLSIGFGLALPFLAMSFVPGLASKLPRPGAWMADLRTLLGFALLATVVWLLWIAGQSAGANGVIWLVAFLLVLGLLVWALGKLQNAGRPIATRLVGASLVIFTASAIALLPLDSVSSSVPDRPADIRRWDADEVRQVVASGRPAFVEFTADWCLSCKVNERAVLETDEIEAAMKEFGIVRFRGDWTLRDDAIFAELLRHGRAGVPLYLVYRSGSPDDPEVLSELLSVDGMIAALRRARR